MWQKFCKWLFTALGWSYVIEVPDVPKCVICVAPHTSYLDFYIGKLFYWALGKKAKFLIKSELFVFPFNYILRSMGGIPVNRRQHGGIVQHVADTFAANEKLQIAITPEGTRKRMDNWKRGFYRIAHVAQVPIVLTTLDFAKKEIGMRDIFVPTGNENEDMRYIQNYFKSVVARYPENFSTGQANP